MQTTFPRLLMKHAAERPDAPAMREKEYGIWQGHSWSSMAALVEHIACGLHQAGLTRGAHMVVIGANRPRLYATMLAAGIFACVLAWRCSSSIRPWSRRSTAARNRTPCRRPTGRRGR